MKDNGIGSWPARRARMSPHRRALVQDGASLTYAELDRLVDRAAHGLRERGVSRADRVAFLGLNSLELVVTMFAAARLGAVFLPLNSRLAPPELAWILDDSEPVLLLHSEEFTDAVAASEVAGTGVPAERITTAGGHGLGALLGEDAATIDPVLEQVDLDDVFMVQYTSGTSGRPKGVVLTHGNITWNAYNLLVDVDLRADEVSLVTAPLFHTAALNQVLLPTLLKGGTALVEAKFDPAVALETIERERVTLLFGVASMYLALAQDPAWQTADLSSLRSPLSGGAPIPGALLETWEERGLHHHPGLRADRGLARHHHAACRRRAGQARLGGHGLLLHRRAGGRAGRVGRGRRRSGGGAGPRAERHPWLLAQRVGDRVGLHLRGVAAHR